jgi:WD40 repeat protein
MNEFQISLSFAGEQRPLVSAVAERLASALGRDQVFYDKYYEAELARPNLDLYLLELYRDRSRLIVVFLGADYERKEWPGLEWRVVRDLIKRKSSERIMLVQVDDGAVLGTLSIDGYLDARGRSAGQIADLILERLRLIGGSPLSRSRPPAQYRCLAPRPHCFVDRSEYQSIRQVLINVATDRSARTLGITTALRGAGGFGKTTLAQALCHDQGVQAAHPDGILWLTMGDQLTNGERLSRMRDLLRRWLRSEPPAFETLDAAGLFLRDLLAGQQVLVVVDDVWSPLDLSLLRDLDPNSTLLVTTRDRRNLPDGCRAVDVDAMGTAEAVKLLGSGVSGLPAERLHALAQRLGEWPLLLDLVRHQIRERVEDDGLEPERALGEVEAILIEEGLEAFDRQDVEARALAVGRTLNASLQRLTEDEKQRYEKLAIFPEDTEIPCSILAGLWSLPLRETLEFCRRLYQLSLAVRFDARDQNLCLHDVVRSCLCSRTRALLAGRHQSFLSACQPLAGWPALPPTKPYLWRHLAYHLVEAGERAELRTLLLDYGWLEAKLAATDVNALLADFDALCDDPELLLIQGALRLSAHALAEYPEELPGQLVGRLVGRSEPGIVALRERACPPQPRRWLRPRAAGMVPPGGALVRTLAGHSGGVSVLAIMADGRVVSGSYDRTLRVWDLATGETIKTLLGHSGPVTSAATLPGGRAVSFSQFSETLRVWDLATGETIRTLEGHSSSIALVAALPGNRALSGSIDWELRFWDLATGETETIRTLKSQSLLRAVAMLPAGRVVFGARNGTLQISDLATGETIKTLEVESDLLCAMAVLPDGRVLSSYEDGTLRVWDLATGETRDTLETHPGGASAVAVLPDGRVVSGSSDGTLRVWDLTTGRITRTLEGHTGRVGALAVLPDGRFVSGSSDGTLRVWNLAIDQPRTLEGQLAPVKALAVLPDDRIVSGASNGILRVWNLATCKTTATFGGQTDVLAIAVLPDGRVVSGSSDSTLRVWDPATGETIRTIQATTWVSAVAVLPGARVACGLSDGTLWVWDLTTGKTEMTLPAPTRTGTLAAYSELCYFVAVALLPDGRIVFGFEDGTLRIWDLTTGETTGPLEQPSTVTAIAVLPDGCVVSGSRDGTLRVWDLATGRTTRSLAGHLGLVSAVAVLPGDRVVSASDDHSLRVWEVATGATVARLTLDAPVRALAVTGERGIVAGDAAGRLHFLRLEDPGSC